MSVFGAVAAAGDVPCVCRRQETPAQHLARQSTAGAVLRTRWIALDLIVQRKENSEKSESSAKPEVLGGCYR